MKKVLLLITILIFSVSVYAQDLSDVKLYINPGHGGYDSNDRFIQATGFWESEGNLVKGLYLRDILESYGATIVMSRTQNRTQDDLALSQIVADANANNVDCFTSIHSNAYDSKTNYTLLIFRGYTNSPENPLSKILGSYLAEEINKAHRTSSYNNVGDWSFRPEWGTQGYGVLRGLTVPGNISEASFHDYIPESWRLRNEEYKKHEAWAIARAYLKFFEKPPFNHGIIAGIIRDPEQIVNYNYSNSSDAKKPLNNIQVTIKPGDKTYIGDEFNNGFFMFDSLTPGEYKLYYQTAGYYLDSSSVNVIANQTVFADKEMKYDTTLAPAVITHIPAESTTAKTIDPVVITFDREMSIASVENAFSISPSVDGKFSWSKNSMSFKPDLPLETNTNYTVTLSTAAKSKWDVPIEKDLVFNFTTNDRRRLTLEKSYPSDRETEISTSVQFKLQFDNSINVPQQQLYLYDSLNTTISLANPKTSFENGKGILSFETKNPLNNNSSYKLVLFGTFKDTEGYPLIDTTVISFNTISEVYVSGTIIDSFDTRGLWQSSGSGFATTGVDTTASSFNITKTKKLFGIGAARLAYVFKNNSDGLCQFTNSKGFTLDNSTSEFGMWVWGDLSNNILEYWFYYDGNTNAEIVADTISWSGWQLKRIPLSTISGTGNKSFHSIVIRQTQEGTKNSIVYIDDAQYNIVVPVKDNTENYASSFELFQNYPNPFNPTTKIRFSIPGGKSEINVQLKIYNVLGKELAELVNQKYSPGNFEIEFDASNLPSGIYLYKLQYGNKIITRKMMLLK